MAPGLWSVSEQIWNQCHGPAAQLTEKPLFFSEFFQFSQIFSENLRFFEKLDSIQKIRNDTTSGTMQHCSSVTSPPSDFKPEARPSRAVRAKRPLLPAHPMAMKRHETCLAGIRVQVQTKRQALPLLRCLPSSSWCFESTPTTTGRRHRQDVTTVRWHTTASARLCCLHIERIQLPHSYCPIRAPRWVLLPMAAFTTHSTMDTISWALAPSLLWSEVCWSHVIYGCKTDRQEYNVLPVKSIPSMLTVVTNAGHIQFSMRQHKEDFMDR
jgi:hypothetical protein